MLSTTIVAVWWWVLKLGKIQIIRPSVCLSVCLFICPFVLLFLHKKSKIQKWATWNWGKCGGKNCFSSSSLGTNVKTSTLFKTVATSTYVIFFDNSTIEIWELHRMFNFLKISVLSINLVFIYLYDTPCKSHSNLIVDNTFLDSVFD